MVYAWIATIFLILFWVVYDIEERIVKLEVKVECLEVKLKEVK